MRVYNLLWLIFLASLWGPSFIFIEIMGILVGFAGVLVLIGPSVLNGFEATTLGLLAVTIAAASYGVAIVYTRLHLRGLSPLVAPTAQLTLAALYLVPLSLMFEQPFVGSLPAWDAIAALLVLAVFGTALAFVVNYHLLERTSATYVSTVTYLIPIFGVVLGMLVLNEQLHWTAYLGCALVLGGVMVINRRIDRANGRPIHQAKAHLAPSQPN